MTDPADLLAAARQLPDRTALLFDFDGSLSPIVDDPAAAVPEPGVAELLTALADRYRIVGVVSGRPVEFLARHFAPTVALSGIYGLEGLRGGARCDHQSAGAWREVVDDVAAQSEARGPVGMGVEAKGLSLTLHFRTRPDLADDVMSWAEIQAARSGLEVRPAKMSVELHPPVGVDKGTSVSELADGAEVVVYVGDDVGDLPAFDALDALATAGVQTVRVAVASDGAPPELLARADITVAGPAELLTLLRTLLPPSGLAAGG
ncbi:MAG: trehalose-phosphatase [Acidimicrobiales bacterium]|nr:trehalose-phosphatase [Acidimicrobiales bacterium]